MSETNDTRREFEAWFSSIGKGSATPDMFDVNEEGEYELSTIYAMFYGWQAATAAKDAKIAALASVTTRQESYNICMSRSLSLHRDGKYAEANEASKCASAVKYATIDMAQKVGT